MKCQLDAKYIKCPFQWWEKHETIFHTIGFLASEILKIVESQIETIRNFSLLGMCINLRKC